MRQHIWETVRTWAFGGDEGNLQPRGCGDLGIPDMPSTGPVFESLSYMKDLVLYCSLAIISSYPALIVLLTRYGSGTTLVT
jgi:hypothetical protein